MNNAEGSRNTSEKRNWHVIPPEECLKLLDTDPEKGLSSEEARRRLSIYGYNRLEEVKKKSLLMRFLAQFNDFMIWVLLCAALISGAVLREYLDAIVIMVIVILNAVLGFIQEVRAEKAMEELKKLSAPTAKVIRDGTEKNIDASELVPGDIIILETGDLIPADARVLSAVNLKTNESSLTGESVPVEKSTEALDNPDTPVGSRTNMVHAGTHVDYGRGKALIVTTGSETQLGEIAQMLAEEKEVKTPLQEELGNVGKKIAYICLGVVLIVFITGLVRGEEFAFMFLFAVSLAVAAIPEGLPAVVTITLAMGTQKMAKENAIIRRLPAVETLGCADFICSDKTGTLTLNQMTVVEAFLADEPPTLFEDFLASEKSDSAGFHLSKLVAALCNDSRETSDGSFSGDSTEVALLVAAKKAGAEKNELEERMPRLMEIPFDSDRKMMSTIHPYENGYIILTKGATEALLARSSGLQRDDKVEPLADEKKTKILEATEELGRRALRTIAFAYRTIDTLPAEADSSEIERDLVFLGAYAMKDPPRQEVFDALATCKRAKISVAMVTGDHPATAQAIGKELGIISDDREFVDATELESMTDEELEARAESISVYARVSPRHKVKIVDALKSRGHVVAMTGDGVNDAPALKRADIGVAMGITGTDVSKEASDMVLMDDNFATIVTAVREGRAIFSNIKKFIYFLLSCNISEVLLMFVAMLAGFPLPLLPVQILWVNLVTDGLPALALGMDTPEADLMDHPPRKLGENILAYSRLRKLLWYGIVITGGALLSFVLAHFVFGYPWENKGAEMARTIVFSTMVFAQLLHSLNFHSEDKSFFVEPPWGNKYLVGALVVSLLLQLTVIYLPFMQKAFHTCAPSLEGWLLIALCSLVPVLIVDRIKVISAKLTRKKESGGEAR